MALINTSLIGRFYRHQNVQFPDIEKPQAIGCFSLDKHHVYKETAESFRYFRMPSKLPLDLNTYHGQPKTKPQRGDERELLYPILHFILNHLNELLSKKPRSSNAKAVEGFDFIGFRGSLRSVMGTPYEAREDWCIQATRFMGNIYMYEKETDKKRQERCNEDDNFNKKYARDCGLKFEQHCLVVNPNEEPLPDAPINECEEFHCMFKTQFPGMTLLYGAVIDGVLSNDLVRNIDSKNVLNSLRFMELSCSLRGTEQQYKNFKKFKSRKWWCQCFLAGIEDIIIGYRNESGFIDEITPMNTQTLIELGAEFWDPSQCADFLVRFLKLVKCEMENVDCPDTVYEFYFNPQSRAIGYRIFAGKSSNTFLPGWYVTALQNQFVEVPVEFEN